RGFTSWKERGAAGASLPLAVDRSFGLDRSHVGSPGNRSERRRLVLSDRQGHLPKEPLVVVGESRTQQGCCGSRWNHNRTLREQCGGEPGISERTVADR